MKSRKLAIWIMVAVLCVFSSQAMALVEFKDGGTHNIDYSIKGAIHVDYQTPDMYTTLNLLDGGVITFPSHLYGYEQSRINVSGGEVESFHAHDFSQVNISGGEIEYFNGHDFSQVNITGGLVDRGLSIFDSSQINITGGIIRRFSSWNYSQINITGGKIRGYFHTNDYSQADISNASIYELVSYGFSQIDVSGCLMDRLSSRQSSKINISSGSIEHWLSSQESSQVNISGGEIGGELRLFDQSIIRMFGTDFAVDGQPFGFRELTSIYSGHPLDEPLRHLSGTLLNGGFIDNDFRIGNDARIILIPEPSTLLLLGLGAAVLRRKR